MTMRARFAASSLTLALIPCIACAADVTVGYEGYFGPAVVARMNNAGQIAGDFQFMSITTAMRYDPGVGIVPRSVPMGSTQSIAYGINSAGATAGRVSLPGGGGDVAAMWSAGNVLTQIGIPAGNWLYNTASGINDNNVVCGAVTLPVVSGEWQQQAWTWTTKGGFSMLPLLGTGVYGIAWDINNAGVVAGSSTLVPNGDEHACIWDAAGNPTDLGVPVGSNAAFARAISETGIVVGGTDTNRDAWKWTQSDGMVTLPDFGFKAIAHDVNSAGWIIGMADEAPFESRPTIWDPNGNAYNLYSLVDQNRYYFPGDLNTPVTINDNNVIVVYGMDFEAKTNPGDPRELMFTIIAPTDCPADVNNSGAVDVDDLIAVILGWGPCAAPSNCPPDTDGNGTVDVDDLIAVILGWGGC